MARAATSRLKVNPPLGNLPVLQYIPPAQLEIDDSYQRSLEVKASQTLIRKMAQFWNWDLCQPLVVSRRTDGGKYVIDGQHRLAAANLRPDIEQLPCVVVEYASAADEAASFVHLNQQRRPLNALDVFKAAIASEDPEAVAVSDAIERSGLQLASHSNYVSWKPDMVSNIGGILRHWRQDGPAITEHSLIILGHVWKQQVKRYAGRLFPGIVGVCAKHRLNEDEERTLEFEKLLNSNSQVAWFKQINFSRSENPDYSMAVAAKVVMQRAFSGEETLPPPERSIKSDRSPGQLSRNFKPDQDNMSWCDQCDRRVSATKACDCSDKFCPLRLSGA